MKLIATKKFESVMDTTIGRTRRNGEVFEVNEDRAKVLLDAKVATLFVEKEEPKAETKTETKKPKKAVKKAKK